MTAWCFVALARSASAVLLASLIGSLGLFVLGFVALFTVSGAGNGSIFKLLAVVMPDRRRASALMGVAGAVGGLGGVLVNLAFRQSFLTTGTGNAAYAVFIGIYVVLLAVTWAVYLRPRTALTAPHPVEATA